MAGASRKRYRRITDEGWLYAEIGSLIKNAREAARMTQEDVALALGMSRSNLANIESGRYAVMLHHLYNLAILFGCPVETLLP